MTAKIKKKHVLSALLILFLILLTVATSPAPPYVTVYNKITYEIDNEYLIIKINTERNAKNYIMAEDITLSRYYRYGTFPVSLGTDDLNTQNFINKINENGENTSGWNFYIGPRDDPNVEPEYFTYGENVYETSVAERRFVVKIKKEIIKYDVITHINVLLHNPQSNDRDEMYFWNGSIDLKGRQ
jgi:hypothetical protein